MPGIVANRRAAVGPCCARADTNPCDAHAWHTPSPPRTRHVREPVREKIRGLVGALLRADERAREALHGERRLRPAALARRHRRQPRPRGHAGRAAASSAPTTSPRSAAAWRPSRARSSAASSTGASTSRTSTSTSRRAWSRSPATPASGCTPAARATTRSRPTCASGCATRSIVVGALLGALQRALVELASAHTETILPGFTHLQVAQPVSFAHHLLAYVEMFSRDAERMAEVRARTNRLPLGAAALAGTSFPLDREAVAAGARHGGPVPATASTR